MKKIGIIGGGIAGLTCAYRLSKKGQKVILFEKEFNVGGRIPYCGAISTEKFQPRLVSLVQELDLNVLKVPLLLKEQGYFTKEGIMMKGPDLPKLFIKELGIRGMISFVQMGNFVNKLNFDPTNPDPKLVALENVSYAQYLNSKYPKKAANFVAGFSSLFIFEDDLNKVSAPYGLCHFRWGNEFSTNKAFGFEENNLATLTNILAKHISDAKNIILTVATAKSVIKEGQQFKILFEKDGLKEEIVDEVVFATPLYLSQEIFPELKLASDVYYQDTKCYFIEGEIKYPEFKFIVGLPENSANLRAIFNMYGDSQIVYPINEDKPVDFNQFFSKYRITQEKELMPAFPIYGPNAKIPDLKTNIPGAYICGDFYIYPTIEAAIASAEKVVEYITAEQ